MHEKAITDTETGGGFQFRISEASGKEHVSHQMLRLRKIFEYMEVSQMICLNIYKNRNRVNLYLFLQKHIIKNHKERK